MKKSLVLFLVALGLTLSIASQAFTFTITMNNIASPDWTVVGDVTTTNGNFGSVLNTTTGLPVLYDAAGTVVSFGVVTTPQLAGGAGASGTFNAVAPFQFDVMTTGGSEIETIDVTGLAAGFVKDPATSNATWTLQSAVSSDGSTTATWAIDPNNGLQALRLDGMLDANPYTLWIDKIISLPTPTSFPIAFSGYITSVPEPGSMAFLIGAGVSGSFLLFRKRRR